MKAPDIPTNEFDRLQALKNLNILDTAPEDRFDRITALVCEVLDVPICAISLIDSDRQWFKSVQGLDVRETSRDVSFCGHVVAGDKAIVVENAKEDSRFFDNPLVVNAPNIACYAGVPLRSVDGYVFGTICAIDSAPRKFSKKQVAILTRFGEMAQTELRNEMLLKVIQLKRDFLAKLSHDFRTPLNSVLGFSSVMLKRGDNFSAQEVSSLEAIHRNGKFLLSMINDLLDLSQIESGRLELKVAVFDLAELVAEVQGELSALAEQKNLTIQLIASDSKCLVNADARRIHQILMNLLGNAIKYSESGVIQIQIDESPEEKRYRVSVKDQGIGIPEELQPYLFQSYAAGSIQDNEKMGSNGLGLAIAQELAKAHGSLLKFNSVSGQGTEFYFSLEKN